MDPEQLEELASSSEAAEGILSAMSECGSPGAEKHPGLSSSSSEEDVYTALANRERDLMLAAELGKALLEKNEELQRKHDQAVEEYTAKIEVCRLLLLSIFGLRRPSRVIMCSDYCRC